MEIGVGGGKTAALLVSHCADLTCCDISAAMLNATRQRLGDEHVRYVKLDGITLSGVQRGSMDAVFCFDTMVHMEPRDIFNYLTQIPACSAASGSACSTTATRSATWAGSAS